MYVVVFFTRFSEKRNKPTKRYKITTRKKNTPEFESYLVGIRFDALLN